MDQAKSAEQQISAPKLVTTKCQLTVKFAGVWTPKQTAEIQDAVTEALVDLDMYPRPRVEIDLSEVTY